MRIAAVVILYYPDEYVVSNIKTYCDHIEKIIVFDNTETEPLLKEELLKLPKVEFYHDYKNEGIAKRLNAGAAMAIEQQFDRLLTRTRILNFRKKQSKITSGVLINIKTKRM